MHEPGLHLWPFGRIPLARIPWANGLLLLGALLATVPLWRVPYPPLQDLPQHLAAIRVLHSYADPAYGFAQHYVLQLLHTQYLAFYLACDALARLVDLQTATLLVASAAVAAIPLSGGALLASLGRDRAMGLLLVPLTYNAHLILGFLNFVAALPLCLYGLSLSVRQRDDFQALRAIGLALLMVLCFYTHVVPCALLMLGHVLVSLSRDWRAQLRAALTLAPSLPAVLLWLLRSPAGAATAEAAGLGAGVRRAQFRPVAHALEQLPAWLLDVFAGRGDQEVMQLWAGLMLSLVAVALVQGLAARRHVWASVRMRLLLLVPLCTAGYLYLPSGYGWIWPIADRFALLACVLALPAIPQLHGAFRALTLAAVLALSTAHVAEADQAFAGFAQEVGDLDGALSAIPPRSKVAGLIFDRGSRNIRFSPFIHFVAYYQARKGGVVMFTFADFPQSPFAFRAENRPPPVPPRWEWLPGRVRPADLAYYDFVLVRGGPGRIAHSRMHEPVFSGRYWSVYRRR